MHNLSITDEESESSLLKSSGVNASGRILIRGLVTDKTEQGDDRGQVTPEYAKPPKRQGPDTFQLLPDLVGQTAHFGIIKIGGKC